MSYCATFSTGTYYEFKAFFKDEGLTIIHREDGPAIELTNGGRQWYINGLRHRIGKPAVKWANGQKEWYINGILHREDGAAWERADGRKYYYLNGKCYSEEEYWAIIRFGDFV